LKQFVTNHPSAAGASANEQRVTVEEHAHFDGTLSVTVTVVIDAEIVLIRFNTSSGDFSNTIINQPPHNPDTECVPASATVQRRERNFAILLVAAQTGDECDSESSDSEWLTWVIVAAVLLAIIISIAVAVIFYLRTKKRREKSMIELKARQEANSWQL
jgi:hypothetical protein